MDGLGEASVVLFMRKALLVQQNADTSLSCHHNNTNSETGFSHSNSATNIGESERGKQHLTTFETKLVRHTNDRIKDVGATE
jgi:hypothetical protein